MEVLNSEGTEGADEVLIITRWQSRDAFDAWGESEEVCTPSARVAPRLTVTAVK
jgi:heme-degrading monooxygenase HmoA